MELSISRYKERHWAIYTPEKELICVCVYKKGARNVVRLMEEKKPFPSSAEAEEFHPLNKPTEENEQ